MENETSIARLLGKRDVDKIPTEVVTKLNKYIEETTENLLTNKALLDTTKRNYDELKAKFEVINTKNQDGELKVAAALENTTELRQQLDVQKTQCRTLTETIQRLETEVQSFRQERNTAFDERDQLLKMSERQTNNIDRLQCDVNTLEAQLQAAIAAKCEAMVRCDEVEGREHNLDQRERFMEQERNMLLAQIENLTVTMNKNMAEVQALRQENTLSRLNLSTELSHKTEELKIATAQIAQYAESIQNLTAQTESLNLKLKEQNEESNKMMQFYQRELQAKDQLCDIYKASSMDNEAEKTELKNAIESLRKMMNEGTEEFGKLETKLRDIDVEHEKELAAKEEVVNQLKEELRNANELLNVSKGENLEHILNQMTPTAAAASRRLKTGMSLTQIYSMYIKAAEDLQLKERECIQTENQLKTILAELEEKAPEWKKQKIEYQNVLATNEELNHQLDKLINERVTIREEVAAASDKFGHMESENKQLKSAQNDLARQVCYLLKEIEQMRGGFTSEHDQSISSDMTSNELISKKLVTFSDIVELQENNQRLLLLVRDLSSRLEEMEEQQASINLAAYEQQIAQYEKRFSDMEKDAESRNKLIDNCMRQRDRFKRLYYEIMRDVGKVPMSMDGSVHMDDDEFLIARSADNDANGTTLNGSNAAANEVKDKRIAELEGNLKDHVVQLKQLREEYNDYRKEKLANDKLLNEQFDQMRREVRELTGTNCNLMSSATFHAEQIKIQQKNVDVYKKQIQTLEGMNRNYDKTIAKHEHSMAYLRDQCLQAQQQASSSELKCDELERLARKLQDDVSRLSIERESLYRERQSQNLLQNNLEMIKTSFERNENLGRIRMEQRFDEAQRECSALRRRLQEEQDHYRALSEELNRKTETCVLKMNDELAQGDGLRKTIEELRAELNAKTTQIDHLSQKLQESLTPLKSDNPIAKANKKIKELENKLESVTNQLEQDRKTYALNQNIVEQLTKSSDQWEATSKELQDTYDQYKAEVTAELATLRQNETALKARIEEQETEIRLQITDAQMSTTDTTTELHKAQAELKETLQKVAENNRELRDLRSECQLLKTSVQTAEQKYSNEMQLHSSDIQALALCKEEMNKLGDQLSQLTSERNSAVDALKSHRNELEAMTAQMSSNKQELEERIQNLDKQNAALHDQLQEITAKVSTTLNDSVNDSSMADSSLLNRSLTEDDTKNATADHYMSIIKFLRKEKDIANKKEEILRVANTRLETEATILQKKLGELNAESLSATRRSTDLSVVSAAKHEEVLRKVETLNAITDSNRCLRIERDGLEARVQELTARVTKLEDDLFPLQENKRELMSRNEQLLAETNSLRRTAEQWQKRATNLVERTNKNPEDFKRLQNERENLAKMLTSEKDTNRVTSEELAALKNEKTRCDAELATLQRQCQVLTEEKKKLGEDIVVLRQQVSRFTQEVMELRNSVLTKEDEMKQVSDTLATTETQLNDIRGKESKVRLIAKRYKDMYYEIKTKCDAQEADMAARPLAEQVATADDLAAAATARQEAEATKARVQELSNHVATLENDLKKLMAENEALKKNNDSVQLQEAKARIKAITEAHSNLQRDYQSSKNQLQTCEQGRSDQDLLLAGIKSQYEARMNRIEKESSEQDAANKETIARLTRENETLNLRVNQFHRQLQSQGSKASTSSGPTDKGPSDAARTANVKPMAGPSGQQSASVTPRHSSTPLASIRPMSVQNSRTAAVLPTSQTSNVAAVQGSSTGSVTALVPPQQQVHTTGQSSSSSAEAMSSSPTSSHTDYMPATSSAVVAAVPPMGSASTAAESSQEAESIPCSANVNESNVNSQAVVGQQQTVALVSPRIEVSAQLAAAVSAASGQQQPAPQPSPQHQQVADQAAASTSGTSSSSTTSSSSVALSTHHQASSSNTVTTTQAAGHKRPREPEGDSSTGVEDSSASVSSDANKTSPKNKRTRLVEQAFQGVSESGIDVEYQVPTSSQRDQEDDNVIVVDSDDEDEDEGMADEGPAEQFEEESYDQEQDDEGDGPDIDEEDNDEHRDTNEVEVDDSSDAPNESAAAASGSDVGTSGESTAEPAQLATSPQNTVETQQIQTISSGSEVRSSTWGSSQSSGQNLILQQAFEETGDDSIVPSTPTLYTARRTDGFSEAVSSPHPQVPQQHAARFTFNEQAGSSRAQQSAGSSNVQLEVVLDDTRVDLQLDQSVSEISRPTLSIPISPQGQQVSPSQRSVVADQHQTLEVPVIEATVARSDPSGTSDASSEPMEAVAGPSGSSSTSADVSLAPEDPNDSASTSNPNNDSIEKRNDDGGLDEDMGADGVTSEGEKVQSEGVQVEEGREAEATIQTPNTRSRSATPRGRVRARPATVDRPTPIVWHEGSQDGGQATTSPPEQQPQQPAFGSASTEPTGRGRGRRQKRDVRLTSQDGGQANTSLPDQPLHQPTFGCTSKETTGRNFGLRPKRVVRTLSYRRKI